MKIASSMMVSNVYNYTKSQNAAKFSLGINDPVSKPKGMDTVSISAAAQEKKTPIVMELPSEFSTEKYIPLQFEKIPEEFQNLEYTSIFDVEEVPQEVKDFLKDKNATAFRYQRLYEEDPKRAAVYAESIMSGHFNALAQLDDQFAGQPYEDVVKYINNVLVEDYTALSGDFNDYMSGNGLYTPSGYRWLFASDDNYGVYHRGMRQVFNGDEVPSKEYLLMDEDRWVSSLEETGYKFQGEILNKPIGAGLEGKTYLDFEKMLANAKQKDCKMIVLTHEQSIEFASKGCLRW